MPRMEILPPDSEFWEKCARHTNKQTSRNIAHIFLCDPCTERVTREALNGRPALYHGDPLPDGGFCGLCNEHRDIALRQWFACTMCWNTVSSYQKSIAAARAIHKFWRDQVTGVAPDLELVELDEMRLEPYRIGGKKKRVTAEELTTTDFVVRRQGEAVAAALFHIEQKAGPGDVHDMSEFQLDVNDYNDIVGPVLNTGLIAYVFHVQVVMEYAPPTRRAAAAGIWWTDILTLRSNLTRVGHRRNEPKPALYFDPRAFETTDTFLSEIRDRRYESKSASLQGSGLSFMDPSAVAGWGL